MRSAYIGLVSRNGLEALLPENEATRRWSRDVSRRHRTECVWAHADPELASAVTALVELGEGAAALRLLAEGAETAGPLI